MQPFFNITNMKTYIVKALAVSGSNNKVFKHGDEVNENQFPRGNAEDLVKKGFLTEVEIFEKLHVTEFGKSAPDLKKSAVVLEPKAEVIEITHDAGTFNAAKSIDLPNGKKRIVQSIDDITKKELINELTKLKIDFDSRSEKIVLFDLWMGL